MTIRVNKSTIETKKIRYFKAQGSYTEVYLKSGKSNLIISNLGTIQQKLCNKTFLRCHHSYILNINEIKEIDEDFTRFVLKSGSTVPISKRKRNKTKKVLSQILSKNLQKINNVSKIIEASN